MQVPIRLIRFDYVLQTILILINVVLTLAIIVQPSIIIFLMWFQLYLGGLQFSSALINYVRPNLSSTIKKWRTWHLLVAIVVIISLILSAVFEIERTSPFGNYGSWVAFWVIILGIPQLLAYSYYYLTHLDYQARRNYMESRIS